jgi:hypothetical protein
MAAHSQPDLKPQPRIRQRQSRQHAASSASASSTSFRSRNDCQRADDRSAARGGASCASASASRSRSGPRTSERSGRPTSRRSSPSASFTSKSGMDASSRRHNNETGERGDTSTRAPLSPSLARSPSSSSTSLGTNTNTASATASNISALAFGGRRSGRSSVSGPVLIAESPLVAESPSPLQPELTAIDETQNFAGRAGTIAGLISADVSVGTEAQQLTDGEPAVGAQQRSPVAGATVPPQSPEPSAFVYVAESPLL